MKSRARELRRRATDAELLLWRRLRGRQLAGCKFRRQVVIEPYIVDFASLEAKLIIEADGGQHAEQADHDDRRTALPEARGYKVMRFWDREILTNIHDVLEKIHGMLIGSPHPDPLPEGEGVLRMASKGDGEVGG